MAIGCRHALVAVGSKAFLVATGGGSKLSVEAMKAEEIDASVCDRLEFEGRLATKALLEAVTNPEAPKGQLITYETPKITKDILADYPPEW